MRPMGERGWTEEDVPAQEGKRYIVTGANSGLGFEISRALLTKGASVVLACRDPGRGGAAVEKLRALGVGDRATLTSLDLGDLASVRAFAEAESSAPAPLDGLVCNAGLMAIPERKTRDGFEMTMGVNHLGHFALVAQLWKKLAAAPEARVVVVSSTYHKMGKIELLGDLVSTMRPYDRWVVYCNSKLANLLFTLELARRIERAGSTAKSTAAHPGYAATELQGHGAQMGGPKWEGVMMAIGNALVAQSVAAGARPSLRATTDPAAKNGDYFGPNGIGEVRGKAVHVQPSRAAKDEDAAKLLWAHSEEITRVSFEVTAGERAARTVAIQA
jgi:NAD(P)-dependent dehydrogenase (short-subunit alcohol dehydrogenase family)